jgi:hypothetical protein
MNSEAALIATSLTEVQEGEIDELLLDNNPLRASKRIREITKIELHAFGDIMCMKIRPFASVLS